MNGSLLLCVASGVLLSGCVALAPRTGDALQPFTDEKTLEEYARKAAIWDDEYVPRGWYGYVDCPDDGEECFEIQEVIVTGMRKTSLDSITNNQEDGVDEGDIVKRVGDYIVLLRRGRLFTFALPSNQSELASVDYIDVEGANDDADAWYDEILVYRNSVLLLGYSYDLEASLIRTFDVDPSGSLSAGDSFYFKSSDYFDEENYATRLVDGHLIFYIPRDLPEDGARMVSGRVENGEAVTVEGAFSSDTVYQPLQQSDYQVVHTIARCPLGSPAFKCEATSIVGPRAQLFYISNDAVYLWLNSSGRAFDYFAINEGALRRVARSWWRQVEDFDDVAIVYRIPVQGGVPGVVETRGVPINQFSFRETEDSLQVLTRDSAWGENLEPAIVDIPLQQFGSQLSAVSEDNYETLPTLRGYNNVNRFVGSSLLYDDVVELEDREQVSIWIKDLRSTQPPQSLPINHLAERIEAVGTTAVVVGSDDVAALGFTPISTGSNPMAGQTLWLGGAVQADERSHSFNYRRDRGIDVLGFPVMYVPDSEDYYFYSGMWEPGDVHMTYLGLTPDLQFQALGEIVGRGTEDDGCLVSCTDWYGDSRPFFVNDRVFALLGYELIEGYLSGATVHESSRANALSLLPVEIRE